MGRQREGWESKNTLRKITQALRRKKTEIQAIVEQVLMITNKHSGFITEFQVLLREEKVKLSVPELMSVRELLNSFWLLRVEIIWR